MMRDRLIDCGIPLSLCIFVLATSCSFRVERDPGILVEAISSDPPTTNPILAADVPSLGIGSYIYESLLGRDNRTLEFVPKLAKRWEISPDHLSYTFWLQDGVIWHDGVPFTADDVIYTFERIRDPAVDAVLLRTYFKDVTRIEKVGESAVRFTYAYPYFKALEIIGSARIIPKHVFDDGEDFNSHPANRNPVGTGPYRFMEWKTGHSIAIERFEGYWGRKPAIRGVLLRVIPDEIVKFNLLKKGALDESSINTIQWARQTSGESFGGKFSRHRFYFPNCSMIAWNLRRPFFADRRVRIAMTMLTNRRAIIDRILFGQGEIVASDFYRFSPNYDDSIQPYEYDPKGAARLLDEAGWIDHDGDGIRDRGGVPFRFSILSRAGDRFSTSVALFLEDDLARAGIDMDVSQFEWATMIGLIGRREFDAVLMGRVTPLDPDFYQSWHSSQAERGSNFIGFADARVDALIEKIRREFDPEKRGELYREFQRILHEEEPMSFLFIKPSFEAVARRFTNVVDYKFGLDSLEWGVGPWQALMEW